MTQTTQNPSADAEYKFRLMVGPRAWKTFEVAVDALEFLVETPSIELPPGLAQEWIDDLRKQSKSEQKATISGTRTIPKRIMAYLDKISH